MDTPGRAELMGVCCTHTQIKFKHHRKQTLDSQTNAAIITENILIHTHTNNLLLL